MLSDMENRRKKSGHISKAQKQILLDLMRERPQLRSGKFTKEFTQRQGQLEWEEITNKLNSIPGSRKEWRLWRKTWQDLQCKAKSKKAVFKKVTNRTGGGPQPDQLDDFEEGVVALINNNSIVGHDGVSESIVEEFVEIYQEVEENSFEDVVPPQPLATHEQSTHGEGSIEIEVPVIPPPPALEIQTTDATATNQRQRSNTNGNTRANTKIHMKTLLKEKLELKRMLVESTIQFQKELIKIQEDRNKILKDIVNKLN